MRGPRERRRLGERHDDFLRRGHYGAADAYAGVAALDLEFGDAGFGGKFDQLADLIYCHQWISLPDGHGRTDRGRRGGRGCAAGGAVGGAWGRAARGLRR